MLLQDHPILKRAGAAILLLLFAFSTTPRKALHDLLVSHTDGTTAAKKDQAQLSQAGFYCNTLNLVAESAFTADNALPAIEPVQVYNFTHTDHYHHLLLVTHFFQELRGPPATV